MGIFVKSKPQEGYIVGNLRLHFPFLGFSLTKAYQTPFRLSTAHKVCINFHLDIPGPFLYDG